MPSIPDIARDLKTTESVIGLVNSNVPETEIGSNNACLA